MSERRPNIILIITDQQRYDTIGALGYPFMETPAIDRLVSEGIALTRCYINAASCVPARASLFTGYHPHTTGILRNGDSWRHSWVDLLARAGYFCVNLGKIHRIGPRQAQGEEEIVPGVDEAEDRGRGEAGCGEMPAVPSAAVAAVPFSRRRRVVVNRLAPMVSLPDENGR